jgi:1,4-dihydroxy-2-naphthoate octaprenyltransferase
MNSLRTLILFIRLARPHFLIGGILLFALGGGIARYLGHSIDWGIYFLGQAWVTMMQLSTHFLNEFYNAPADADNQNRTLFTGGSGVIWPRETSESSCILGVDWLAWERQHLLLFCSLHRVEFLRL